MNNASDGAVPLTDELEGFWRQRLRSLATWELDHLPLAATLAGSFATIELLREGKIVGLDFEQEGVTIVQVAVPDPCPPLGTQDVSLWVLTEAY
jgi:hypothetical protein